MNDNLGCIYLGLETNFFYSDDDLPPINPDDEDEDDGSVNGVKPPVYLRDCIAGKNAYSLMSISCVDYFKKELSRCKFFRAIGGLEIVSV